MKTAKIFIEIGVDITKDDPNDKSLSFAEIADHACGGIALTIREAMAKNKRPTQLLDARYEFTISKKCI